MAAERIRRCSDRHLFVAGIGTVLFDRRWRFVTKVRADEQIRRARENSHR
jgi:hypothetical protein